MGAFWGSLAALGIGLSDLFGRRVVNTAGPIAAALAMQAIGCVTALISVLFVASEIAAVDMAWGALSGLGMAAGLGCYFGGVSRSSATIVAPLVATLAAIIPYLYSIVRGSVVSGLSVVAASLAFVGLGIVAAGADDVRGVRSGLGWGMLSGCAYGFGISVLVEVSDEAGVWPAVSQRFVGVLALGGAAVVTHSAMMPGRGQQVNGIAAGLFAGLSSIFVLVGLAVDAPSTVVTQSMFPAFSVVVGFLYYGDSLVRRQLIGLVLVLVGVAGVVAL